jgi:hypothetical protein
MNKKIQELLARIRQLEQELEDEISLQSRKFREDYERRRIRFDKNIKSIHRSYRKSVIYQIFHANPLFILIAPIIYAMIVPIVFMDITIWIYQRITFPVYRIPIVPRKAYFVIDRHHLSYLNSVEKVNCIYCGYGNAVAAYTKEIIARTELFWCPIKHASRLADPHSRYDKFFDYGDAEKYRKDFPEVRKDYTEEE